jgi:spore coat protein U-like protein
MARALPRACVLLVLAALAHAPPAGSATDTDVLHVTATVQSSCSLSGGNLDFGTYTSGQPGNLDATGTISFVNCNGNLSFALDGGSSGNVNARYMQQGASRLFYQIYRNSVRNAVWGSGSEAHSVVLFGAQSGSVPVYGRIPPGQSVPDGTYTDTVNITLTF